ncbi:arabinose transporter [Microvirga sp. HBU67558]|uniref:arabinose transporter n=1 Tax=Microvirga TaxID=186650 RepID=UPI001B366671|nr:MULTISPECIES: arabinose transporter [unclassified Microvirga]MBQ0820680.1 arabinose transporter [Microvirga sp. HBU67558]
MLVASSKSRASTAPSVLVILLPIMAVVLFGFLIAGLALPVLPLHVHQGLGLSTFVVGLITGSQFAASLISRLWSGHYADSRGAKRAVVPGLLGGAAAGLLYLVSLSFIGTPAISATILLLGRALLGGAESFIITGAFGWALAQVDARHAGKVIAWVGTAMWAAFALGAPLGSALYASYGFVAIALATTLIPLATLLLVLPLRSVVPPTQIRPAFTQVIGAVWVPGIGMALSSVGFGAITAFIALRFVDRGWAPVWLAFSAFAGAFIVARVVGGHLPDKLGGAKVALASVLIEAAGQALIWLAPGPMVALAGAVLSGIGWSLVYPSFGIEAVRRAPPESRALAMGAYTAFLDLAIGLASPALGAVAGAAGLGTVFLVSALVVLGAALIAVRLLNNSAIAQ